MSELLEDEADWDRPRRVNRWTWILLGVLVALLAFAGGVTVQKAHDASLVSGRTRTAASAGRGSGEAPAVAGTIKAVSGRTLTVTDARGTAVTVHVPAGTPVTAPGLGGPAVGATVSVTGTTAADGSVTASAVTVRAGGG